MTPGIEICNFLMKQDEMGQTKLGHGNSSRVGTCTHTAQAHHITHRKTGACDDAMLAYVVCVCGQQAEKSPLQEYKTLRIPSCYVT